MLKVVHVLNHQFKYNEKSYHFFDFLHKWEFLFKFHKVFFFYLQLKLIHYLRNNST